MYDNQAQACLQYKILLLVRYIDNIVIEGSEIVIKYKYSICLIAVINFYNNYDYNYVCIFLVIIFISRFMSVF